MADALQGLYYDRYSSRASAVGLVLNAIVGWGKKEW